MNHHKTTDPVRKAEHIADQSMRQSDRFDWEVVWLEVYNEVLPILTEESRFKIPQIKERKV